MSDIIENDGITGHASLIAMLEALDKRISRVELESKSHLDDLIEDATSLEEVDKRLSALEESPKLSFRRFSDPPPRYVDICERRTTDGAQQGMF